MRNQKYLLVIVGPTAVGKTELCLKLAKKFNSEIISCDSRQFYREMNLGTAKPSHEELDQVPHHLIDSHSIFEEYDVKQYESDVLAILDKLYQKSNMVLLTGGSGMYADIITQGMDSIPDISPEIREEVIRLYQQNGLEWLQNQVSIHDPIYFDQVDRQNPQRLMRALEVCLGTQQPYSNFRQKKKVERPFVSIKIGLDRDREELYQRIDDRMDQMIEKGLFEEAESLFPYRNLNALQTVGYTEIFDFMEGVYDRVEAIRLLKRNSRRYAKRQMTWFRKDPEIQWFHPDQFNQIIDFISAQIALNPPNAATQL
ncbi:tRNA (adenosine(37)-N6)-dimethylallyltransferase MiaA [Algoriphagus sanaruensis]|nr:tRNA (adenosine(37)-N6)-dimethylallyltransferase MiaA [Algoriphagus sanaruensis]